MMTRENIFKDNWKKYSDLGLPPIPAYGKRPILDWGESTPPPVMADYADWGGKFPTANVWVKITDKKAVLEPDGPGAEEAIQSFGLPVGPISISGSGAKHRWFKVSAPIKPIKALNGGDKTFLELRTGKLGMLVPPSIHPGTGKPYRWAEGLSPWHIDFPELPIEVYEKIKALAKKSEPKMEPGQEGLSGSLDVQKYLDHFEIKYSLKADGARIIYALEKCFFADSHSTPDAKGDSSIIQGPDGKLAYHCFHNHCSLRTWKDARAAVSGNATIQEFLRGHKPANEKSEDRATVSLKQAILDADQIQVMTFPVKRKILDPWLSEQTITLVVGWRGLGKTWLALSIADCITRGIAFGPWATVTPVPVLYIDGEMAIQDTQERLGALTGGKAGKRKESLLIYSDAYGNSLGLPKANLLNHKWRNAIRDICTDWSVKLLILDNLSSLCPGIDENSKLEWDPVNQWLLDLRFRGLSVVMLHHVNKMGGQRGTSGREDNIDISITLAQPADYVPEDGCRFIAKFSKARIRTADLKMIQDTEFQLKENIGQVEWTFSGMKKKNKTEILRLLSEGVSQTAISETLGLSKGRISQIRLGLIEEGLLTKKGEITMKGKRLIDGD